MNELRKLREQYEDRDPPGIGDPALDPPELVEAAARTRNADAAPPPGKTAANVTAAPATARRLREVPAYVPFPSSVLPGALQALIDEGATAIGCDETYIALPALATLSAAIGSTRRVEIKPGWREPPYVSTAVIAPSGAKKSPPFRLAAEDPAEDINDRLEHEHRAADKAYKAELEKWKSESKEERGERPIEPLARRFSFSDITIECLQEKLNENRRGLLITYDELNGWLRSFTRYSADGSSNLPIWLSLFSAATVNTARVGGKRNIRARGVGVAVTGTIQPKVIRDAMTPEFMAAGLFARLAIAMPPVAPRVWTDAEIDEDVARRYGRLVDDLFRYEFASVNEYGRPVPKVVPLSRAARHRFIEFYNRNGDAMAVATDDESAARSKLEGYAARFALIFHCCRTTLAEEIDDHDMRDGVVLAEWFINENLRIAQMFAGSQEEHELRDLSEKVRAFAKKHSGKATARDLHKSNRSRWPTVAHAELALDSLVSAGEGVWEEGGGAGRPTRFFTPKPTPLPP